MPLGAAQSHNLALPGVYGMSKSPTGFLLSFIDGCVVNKELI